MPIPSFELTNLEEPCADLSNYGSIRRIRYCLSTDVDGISDGIVSLKPGKSFKDLPFLEDSARLRIQAEQTEQGVLNTPGLECRLLKLRSNLMSWLRELEGLALCVLAIDANDVVTVLYPVKANWTADSEEVSEQPNGVRLSFVPSRNLIDRYNSYFSSVPPPPVIVPPVVSGDYGFEFDVDFD